MSRTKRIVKNTALTMGRLLGLRQSQARLLGDAEKYWTAPRAKNFAGNSHWSNAFSDETWNALGREHWQLFEEFGKLTPATLPLQRMVEWGCGGGANAIHFAPACHEFVGVDLSDATLAECQRQLTERGLTDNCNFVPVRIDMDRPEVAARHLAGTCDFYLCTYVFELIASQEYGRRLLRITAEMLKPGGTALIQIKYATEDAATHASRWGYRLHLANMTTYRIEEFWELASEAGLTPLAVRLQPRQPLVNDTRYAYFWLRKASCSHHSPSDDFSVGE